MEATVELTRTAATTPSVASIVQSNVTPDAEPAVDGLPLAQPDLADAPILDITQHPDVVAAYTDETFSSPVEELSLDPQRIADEESENAKVDPISPKADATSTNGWTEAPSYHQLVFSRQASETEDTIQVGAVDASEEIGSDHSVREGAPANEAAEETSAEDGAVAVVVIGGVASMVGASVNDDVEEAKEEAAIGGEDPAGGRDTNIDDRLEKQNTKLMEIIDAKDDYSTGE